MGSVRESNFPNSRINASLIYRTQGYYTRLTGYINVRSQSVNGNNCLLTITTRTNMMNTPTTPTVLTATTSQQLANLYPESLYYVVSSGGHVTQTVSQQFNLIAPNDYIGTLLWVIGTSNTNYNTFVDDAYLVLDPAYSGRWDAQLNKKLQLVVKSGGIFQEVQRG